MPTLEIEIPADYHRFNLERWTEIMANEELARFQGKVESYRHGQILMMPPASGVHSTRQSRIFRIFLEQLGGEPLAECPVSTMNGVRAVDVGWYSHERFAEVRDQMVFQRAPEVCVEVRSPSNTDREMNEKKVLYFEAGAEEVWMCSEEGDMEFFGKSDPGHRLERSTISPDFPLRIEV